MKVTVLLADSAQSDSTGKVHALGLGWSRTTVPNGPMAVIVQVEFDRDKDQASNYEIIITLEDEDGELPALEDGKRFRFKADADYQPGENPGPDIASLVINLGPGLPLKADRLYHWRVTVNGRTEPHWAAGFRATNVDLKEPVCRGL